MRSASSSVISSAPDSTVPVIRARRSSSTGLEAPTTLRKPAPISQGVPVSDSINVCVIFSHICFLLVYGFLLVNCFSVSPDFLDFLFVL